VIYAQDRECAPRVRLTRVTSAGAFAMIMAVIIAARPAMLQALRADRFIEFKRLGLHAIVARIHWLGSMELERELDDCMHCIGRRVRGLCGARDEALRAAAGCERPWQRVGWLTQTFYAAAWVTLTAALAHRLLSPD
jgi:hypothetical protein